MANPTMTLIASNTVGSGGASSVTFSPIPSTYTDLKLVISVRTNRALLNDYLKITINGSSTGYSGIQLEGDGSSVSSGTFSGIAATQYAGEINGATGTTSVFTSVDIYFPNYSSSNYKSYSVDSATENNATTSFLTLDAGLWSNSSAITSITLAPGVGTNLIANSTFYLYGIKNS
jgi:hypothetical protein